MVREALVALHRWLGLTAAAFLLLLGLTGCLLVFENEFDAAWNPKLFEVIPQHQKRSLEEIAHAPADKGVTEIRLAERPDHSYQVSLSSGRVVFVDPYSAKVLGSRRREQIEVVYLHNLHTQLLAGLVNPTWAAWAYWITGGASLVACLMMLSGLPLWLKYKLLSVRWREGGPAINFDLHNVTGFYTSLVLLMIAATGAAIAFDAFPAIERRMGDPPRPRAPRAVEATGHRITLDQAVSAAERVLPGAAVALVSPPQGSHGVFRVQLKYPEDRTPAGRSRVYVDPYSGKPLLVEDFRTAPAGMQITNRIRSLHTGDIFGWPTRILYAVVALILVLQVITGFAMWMRRRRAAGIGMPRGFVCEEQPDQASPGNPQDR